MSEVRGYVSFIGAAIIVALMVVSGLIAVLKIDLTPPPEKDKAPVRERNLAEGVRLSRHGLYGIDLVKIGRAHMRKLRKGPFTIGAINELVLEDVSLTLPEELWRDEEASEAEGGAPGEQPTGPKRMLSKLGIKTDSLRMGERVPRFSALAIRNLCVARLEGTNAVPWFAARSGEAKRSGLELEDGYVIEDGKTNRWHTALLVIEPRLALKPLQ